MTDMIERVAKRLWDHSFDRMPEPPWEQTSELQKRFNRMLAREAIAEMREPTEATVAAGAMAEGDGNLDAEARNLWSAMIDAALAPATTGRPT